MALTKDKSRVIWGFSSVETVLSDLRYGLRMIVKWPGFSFVVILILALGIGATTAIFSAVNAVLLQPLPYPQSDRLMMVIATSGKQDWRKQPVTVTGPCFDEWKQHNQVFEQIGGFINAATPTNISGGARPTGFVRLGLRLICLQRSACSRFWDAISCRKIWQRFFQPGWTGSKGLSSNPQLSSLEDPVRGRRRDDRQKDKDRR